MENSVIATCKLKETFISCVQHIEHGNVNQFFIVPNRLREISMFIRTKISLFPQQISATEGPSKETEMAENENSNLPDGTKGKALAPLLPIHVFEFREIILFSCEIGQIASN